MKPLTEVKVPQAAAGGSGLFAVSQLVIWVLGCWIWGASWDADKWQDAYVAVPPPVTIVVGIVLTYAGAYFFGWRAPHTHRPDLERRPKERMLVPAAGGMVPVPEHSTQEIPPIDDVGLHELFTHSTGEDRA